MPTNVEPDATADCEDGATWLLTAADARKRRIPLRKQKYAPGGPHPNECFCEAGPARDATLLDGDLVSRDQPALAEYGNTMHVSFADSAVARKQRLSQSDRRVISILRLMSVESIGLGLYENTSMSISLIAQLQACTTEPK